MSTTVSVHHLSENSDQLATPIGGSTDDLRDRISREVLLAEERVQSLQNDAAHSFVDMEGRLAAFIEAANRVHAILIPRLQTLTSLEPFRDIGQVVSLELQGLEEGLFHSRTTTLQVPNSDKRPTAMEFSFCASHDDSLLNVVLDYRLEVRPIFVKFDGHDQFVASIQDLNDAAIAAWIAEKLVAFSQTYFAVYFHHEYQKSQMETDPVMNLDFPRAFAVGR